MRIACDSFNPDPAYAPTFDTTPEDRPSALERAGETGLAVAIGAAGIKLGALAEEGVTIRNKHLAGEVHPVTGVPFDEHGYPDFKAAGLVEQEVQIEYTGSRSGDFRAANKAAGLKSTPEDMTWHHHQDKKTMQLIPKEAHKTTGHTGGFGLR